MASRFDPSAFIAAERAVETVEATSAVEDAFSQSSERADFRRFRAARDGDCRTIEGIEPPAANDLPWSAGMRTLAALPRPIWMKGEAWDRLVYICDRLHRRWGETAHAHGWTAHDLFGCHPRPAGTTGIWLNGLAMTIFGLRTTVKLTAIEGPVATLVPAIETLGHIPPPPAGAAMRVKVHIGDRPGQSLIWEAFAPAKSSEL